ncbi:MAG: hypothetical protein A2X80_07880 [Geobacteraceae bacterium GWB2_52_12]|nr:MAG: hypothetical protein A2X80_07880 [Geobacteraceae bacterium GWB2_52_12]
MNANTFTSTVISNIVVVLLNISLWQGRKKLRSEDLEEKGISASSLPPEKLASLGSKRIVSPDAVNVFMALKRRAERSCLAVGTRFLGGYAVPEEKMPILQAELDLIGKEFDSAKSLFLSQYETTVKAWAAENPEWEDAIMRAVDSPAYVAAQLHCGFTAMKVNPVAGAEKTLDNQVTGLKGQLEREIALAAKTAWEESFQGKLAVRRSAMGKLEAIADKLDGLSFLDTGVGSLHKTVTAVLEQVKDKTPIEGSDLMSVSGVLATLISLDRIRFKEEAEAASFAATPPPAPEPIAVPDHFTDFGEVDSLPVINRPVIRVNGETWDNDDLPFGGEAPVIPVAPPTAKVAFEPPDEWF